MAIGTLEGAEYQVFTDSANRECAVPGTPSDGDLLIALVILSQANASTANITVTNGTIASPGSSDTANWDQSAVARVDGATHDIGRCIFLRKYWHTGDATTYTFGTGASGTNAVIMVRVPGGDKDSFPASPTVTNQTAPSTTVTTPAITVPSGLPSNAAVLRFYYTYYFNSAKDGTDTWTVTNLTSNGFTELCDQSDEWCSVGASGKLAATGSTEVSRTVTAGGSQSGAIGRGISIVINPLGPTSQTIDVPQIGDVTVTLQAVDPAKYVDVDTIDVASTMFVVDPIKDLDPMVQHDVTLSIQPVDVIKSPKVLFDLFVQITPLAITAETLTKEIVLEDTIDVLLGWDSPTVEIIDRRVYADLETVELGLIQFDIDNIEKVANPDSVDLSLTVGPVSGEKLYLFDPIIILPQLGTVDAFGTNRAGLVDMFVTVQSLPKAQHVVDLTSIDVTLTMDIEADWARGDTVQSAVDVGIEIMPIHHGKGYHLHDTVSLIVQPLGFEVGFSVDDSAKKQLAKIKITKQPTRVIAQDILTGRFLNWDLEVSNLTLTKTLSGPQVISGEFPNEIRDLADAGLDAWATWIHVEEDGKIRGSGILQPRSVDQGEALSLEAVGVSAYAAGIPYLEEYIKVQIDPADVVREIWRHIQSYPNGNLGVVVRGTTPVRIGQEEVPAPAEGEDTRTDEEKARKPYALVWWEAPDSATEIANLAKETPFDFVEREEWNADKTDVLHYIDIGFPRFGRYRDDLRFAQEENLVTAIGPGEAADMYASQVVFIGSGEGRETVRGYAGKPMGGRVRRVVVLDDKSVNTSVRANALSADELLRRQALQDVTEVEIDARHLNARLGSFDCGDDIPVVAEVPWVGSVRQWERVLSYTYSPDAETIRVSLRRSESFTYGTGASTT